MGRHRIAGRSYLLAGLVTAVGALSVTVLVGVNGAGPFSSVPAADSVPVPGPTAGTTRGPDLAPSAAAVGGVRVARRTPAPTRTPSPSPRPSSSSPSVTPSSSARATPPPSQAPSPTRPPEATPATVTAAYSPGMTWSDGYSGTVTVTNRGPSRISGWTVVLSFPAGVEVDTYWNAGFDQVDTFDSDGWSLKAGGTASFGFTTYGRGAPTISRVTARP